MMDKKDSNAEHVDVSVVICTYNGADDMAEVLDHLSRQVIGDDFALTWEVIVADNNSTDHTEEVVRQYQKHWPSGVALRYIFEGRQGKSYAMQAGANAARGSLVAFLDDDTIPAPNWVVEIQRFAEAYPQAGVFGGQVHGQFEQEPPPDFGAVRSLFAPNQREELFCYSSGSRLVFGASGSGLVVRKAAWDESIPASGLERKGPTGSGRGTLGEEYEIQWRIYKNGWEIWHNPEMHLDHKIPSCRFEKEYLDGFFKAIGLSRHHTRMMRFEPWQRPFATGAYWLSDVGKLARMVWRYRTKVLSDLFIGGRAKMRMYMLIAPFK